MKKIIFATLLVCFTLLSQSQNKTGVSEVNKNDLLNLSLPNKTVIVYTFSIKCEPCILHLKNAINLSEQYKIELYILLVEKNGKYSQHAIDYLKQRKKDINIITISDDYGKKNRKSYKKILTQITPKKFKNINDFSKYIVIKNGKIIMVTNYKDNEISDDWRDDTPMIETKITPLLDKK